VVIDRWITYLLNTELNKKGFLLPTCNYTHAQDVAGFGGAVVSLVNLRNKVSKVPWLHMACADWIYIYIYIERERERERDWYLHKSLTHFPIKHARSYQEISTVEDTQLVPRKCRLLIESYEFGNDPEDLKEGHVKMSAAAGKMSARRGRPSSGRRKHVHFLNKIMWHKWLRPT
jgi:hypothetical protein